MEGSRSDTSATETSEEIIYTSVKFSATPPRDKAAQERRDDSYPHCPEHWIAYRGSCYSFSKEKKDWRSSQESCWAQGAHLLVISDTSEMNLFKSIQTACFWIGLSKTTGSDWIWEDGSILNGTQVLSNSPVQQCAVLIRDLFQASSCEFSAAWICEKSLR
ncbi:killer cell lectin-like receptor subfamily G member 1 isoform X2 [Anser cygnoides]|uniref:killer cell lectin-like receptor subfamily G member 1 isoform X2 n=1 Tax=Anser cygnoides TaxID=8845 RepID=UPI002009CA62|nr:killer cell lectin-like receptor subfamily G member 1 isoform X2 [Anser cygnoides]